MKSKSNEYLLYKAILNEQLVLNDMITKRLVAMNKDINTILHNREINQQKKNLLDYKFLYQDVCILVCVAIFNVLRTVFNIDDFDVTVLHRFKLENNEYIKVIAFANRCQIFYPIYNYKFGIDNCNDFRVEIFKTNEKGNLYVLDKFDIMEKFLQFKDSKHDIMTQQYIGIPVSSDGIVSLLQIETSTKNLFGKTKEDVYNFTKSFTIFSYFLSSIYQQDILFNGLNQYNRTTNQKTLNMDFSKDSIKSNKIKPNENADGKSDVATIKKDSVKDNIRKDSVESNGNIPSSENSTIRNSNHTISNDINDDSIDTHTDIPTIENDIATALNAAINRVISYANIFESHSKELSGEYFDNEKNFKK